VTSVELSAQTDASSGSIEPGTYRATRYPLRGHIAYSLIQDLARQEKRVSRLARDYGVSESAIRQFRDRKAVEIAAARKHIENEFETLWIADKVKRLAEYQDDVERINESLPDGVLVGLTMEGDGDEPKTIVIEDKGTTALLRTKAKLLRNAAEEMGQLPARTNIQVVAPQTIVYEVAGVDLTKLQ